MAPIPIPRNFNDPPNGDGKPSQSKGESPMKETSNPVVPPLPAVAPQVPPIKIPIVPLSSKPTPIAPKPPVPFNPMMPISSNIAPSFTGERSTPVPKTETPMLKDFPTIPAKTSPMPVAKVETKASAKEFITPKSISAMPVHVTDRTLVFLSVVAFIIAVVSAVLLGAGYFDLL